MYGKNQSNKKISISLYLIITCVVISLIPIVIYSILSMFFFSRVADNVHELQLKKYLNDYIDNNKTNITNNFIFITSDYSLLPENIKSSLPINTETNILHKVVISDNADKTNDELYYIIIQDFSGKKYYAIQKILRKDVELYIKPQIMLTFYILLGSSVLILFILLIFIKFIVNRIELPIQKLSNWSIKLSYKNINDTLPDFTYPELQNIANFIQKNLKKEYDQLNNEEIFWRYCSHELHTPIATIGVGLDYLQKLTLKESRNYEKKKTCNI